MRGRVGRIGLMGLMRPMTADLTNTAKFLNSAGLWVPYDVPESNPNTA
jgi:hypothetical protein